MRGFNRRRTRLFKWLYFATILVVFVAVLSSCDNDQTAHPQSGTDHKKTNQKAPPSAPHKEIISPIKDIEGVFYEIVGWIDDRTILYIVNQNGGSNIYFYNLITGENRLFYENEHPIVNAEISPKNEQVLIHAAPFGYEAELKILTLDGSVIYETRVESFELAFEWNQENENEILISVFHKDWSFENFILNSNTKSMTKIKLPQPFVIWSKREELFYLNWDTDSPNLSAPLIKENIISGKKQQLLSSAHYIDSAKDHFLVIQASENNPDLAVYTIFNQLLDPISQFEVVQLSTFSGWLVPHYDLIESKKSLLHFRPETSGEADLYGGGFTLTDYSFEDEEETEIMSDLENEPLSCSPEGSLCLYGYQFEKLIDLKEKEIINLIIE